jgi:hypothetical protein
MHCPQGTGKYNVVLGYLTEPKSCTGYCTLQATCFGSPEAIFRPVIVTGLLMAPRQLKHVACNF